MAAFLPLIVLLVILYLVTKKLSHTRPADAPGGPGDRKLISSSSFLLRIFGSSHSYKASYYFDTESFYEVTDANTTTIPLAAITGVKRESTEVNNRSVWSVSWSINGQQKQARFLHNYTLFNRSFAVFLEAVKQANPHASVSALTLFTL